ncbi:hypothetical protein RJ639_026169 [Escallonia herrerae]|uniref:Uncharacterized protein n=1 Tax=Escallonia herrerae TaxID=1293975 RepID=A0AA88UX99_9ASTE|nr:hypothetical protein RJ639_026169 [Escallonia herrerae]
MADLDQHSTSDDASVDSRVEDSSQDSKLEFSEDEETLIARMYNLVGERIELMISKFWALLNHVKRGQGH